MSCGQPGCRCGDGATTATDGSSAEGHECMHGEDGHECMHDDEQHECAHAEQA